MKIKLKKYIKFIKVIHLEIATSKSVALSVVGIEAMLLARRELPLAVAVLYKKNLYIYFLLAILYE